jgi:pimeloyl-ACP methyl ester carboxylesterase
MKNLVFFHGWGASGRIWRRQAAAFEPKARVLAPDIPAWEPEWFWQYLQEIKLPETVLVGWSLGGMLLAEALARRPEPWPAALVLVGVAASFCLRRDFPHGQPAAAVRAMRRALKDDPRKVLREFARSCLAPGETPCRGEVEAVFGSPAHPENLAPGLDYLLRQDLRKSLSRLPGGTVIIHGREDAIVAAAQAEYLYAGLPGSRLEMLPGAGHLPFLTRASAFNEVLEELLGGGPGTFS